MSAYIASALNRWKQAGLTTAIIGSAIAETGLNNPTVVVQPQYASAGIGPRKAKASANRIRIEADDPEASEWLDANRSKLYAILTQMAMDGQLA